jgi:hypothetical protein
LTVDVDALVLEVVPNVRPRIVEPILVALDGDTELLDGHGLDSRSHQHPTDVELRLAPAGVIPLHAGGEERTHRGDATPT